MKAMRRDVVGFILAGFIAAWLTGCSGVKNIVTGSPTPPDGRGVIFAVQSTPPGAEILLDGQPLGFRTTLLGTDPYPLPPPQVGTHLLSLRIADYHAWHQWVDWTGDASVIVKASLTPSDAPAGTLVITSDPPGARILLDGTAVSQTTPATLPVPPSRHAIAVTLDGYLPARDAVDVPAQGTATVHFPLTRQDRGVVTGTLYDRFGNTPVGADVQLRDLQGNTLASTRTTTYGAFQFANVPPGTYTVVAEAQVQGVREVAQSDALTVSAGQRTHTTLVLFPADILGDIEGVVQTPTRQPVPEAQVAVLYYAVGLDFVLTSRRTVTDGAGRFRFSGLPAAQQVLVARKVGFQPTQTQALPRTNETVQVTVTLAPLGDAPPSLQPPSRVFAIAETLPTTAPPRSRQTGADFYRQLLLRRWQRAGSQTAVQLLKASARRPHRFFPQGFIGQVEVGWQPPVTRPSEALLGYRVYRSVPSASGWQRRLTVDEPEQTVVADIGYDLTPNQTYRYAVSAIRLNGQETEKSEAAETSVLPPLRLLSPDEGAAVAQSQLEFRWETVGGTVPYFVVQLFSDPEELLVGDPVWDSDILVGVTAFRYDGQPLLKGKTYWWVVIGLNARDWLKATAFTVSPVRQAVIAGD